MKSRTMLAFPLLVLFATFATAMLTPVAAATAAPRLAGPFHLTSLPALGVVKWTCGPRFDTFRADERVTRRTRVDPGQTVRSAFLRTRTQRLEIGQRTEPGLLRASVSVDFTGGGIVAPCYAYSPPRETVQISPRR